METVIILHLHVQKTVQVTTKEEQLNGRPGI